MSDRFLILSDFAWSFRVWDRLTKTWAEDPAGRAPAFDTRGDAEAFADTLRARLA